MPQMEPVNVAYLLPNFERGGTEKHVLDLVAGIDRRRFRPCVVGVLAGGPLSDEFRRLEAPVHVVEYRGFSRNPANAGRYLYAAWRFFHDLARILRERRVKIAHAYLPSANVLGTIGARLAGVPVRIVSKRALCRYKEGHPVFSFFENLANLAADVVLVNSEAVARDVRRHERFLDGKIVLVRNGIDPGRIPADRVDRLIPDLPWNEGDAVVTYVANLFPYKGHRDLIAAAAVVVEAIPTVRFLLVGRDAGEREALQREISSRGLERHVHLAGERKEATRILASSTLAVHPSHEEGFSNTILEAMAAEKAVVATRVGGIPEAVIDGETGLLVPPHDPHALADALLCLLRDPDRAQAMGRAGRKRVREHFTVGKMVAAVERTYVELLEGRPPSCRT
jgi:glycosyltransferase involved in cell wall biosynthesis